MPRTRTLEEVGEDLDEIKGALGTLSEKLDQRFVPRELYEAKHEALRHEVAREFAAIKAETASAKTLAQWCFAMIAVAIIGAIVTFVAAGLGGPT